MGIFKRLSIPEVSIYTDGSCDNHGYGGWGAIILGKNSIVELCGNSRETTNNKMELTAVVESIDRVQDNVDVVVYTDSQYVVSGIENIFHWRDNNWITKSSTPVKNLDLWKRFIEVIKNKHSVKAIWVKGHNNLIYNEHCDTLAKRCRDKLIDMDRRKGIRR